MTVAAAPDFSVSANPNALTITTSSSGVSIIAVSSLGGFAGTVKLSGSVQGHKLTLNLSPSSVLLSSGSSATASLNVSTTQNTVPGSYSVMVTGRSGKLSHSISISVTVIVTSTTPLGIDGSGSFFCGNSTTSCQTVISTINPNDIITVYTTEALDLQTSCFFSVSDTASLSWIARPTVVFSSDGREQLQEFWAMSPNPLSSDTITESISGCGSNYNGLMAFGVSGANLSNPFDPNLTLPATGTSISNNPSVQVSTSNPNDMIIAGAFHGNNNFPLTAGPGFTIITSFQGAAEAAEFSVVNTTLTSSTVSFVDASSDVWLMIADAVQAK
jgi:hypothetical protein